MHILKKQSLYLALCFSAGIDAASGNEIVPFPPRQKVPIEDRIIYPAPAFDVMVNKLTIDKLLFPESDEKLASLEKFLDDSKIHPDSVDSTGKTLIGRHLSYTEVRCGYQSGYYIGYHKSSLAVIQLLLRMGADPNKCAVKLGWSHESITYLHKLALEGREMIPKWGGERYAAMVHLFCSHGARTDATDELGSSVASCVESRREQFHKEAITNLTVLTVMPLQAKTRSLLEVNDASTNERRLIYLEYERAWRFVGVLPKDCLQPFFTLPEVTETEKKETPDKEK